VGCTFVERLLDRGEELGLNPQACPVWLSDLTELLAEFRASRASPTPEWWDAANEVLRDARERLAELARPIERLPSEPLGEVEGEEFGSGVALFAALFDSLVLATSDVNDRRQLCASSEEMHDLLVASRKDGLWDLVAAV
jgi:hypothetical protein